MSSNQKPRQSVGRVWKNKNNNQWLVTIPKKDFKDGCPRFVRIIELLIGQDEK